ncbi:MAG: hypothetical protein V1726_01955 [Methanobacteriota archaeon]
MRLDKRLCLLGLLFLIATMVVATQYALTKVGYVYMVVHPSDADIRYIGSDNASDGFRVLRVNGANSTRTAVILHFGNYSTNMVKTFSAAFGIVNEENYTLHITYINVTSENNTYLRIYLHGNRTANAESNLTDPSMVYMYNNGTIMNSSSTIAWTLAPGDRNTSTMCANVSNSTYYTIPTPWDNTSHVRYSINNTNAVSNVSDFVWVQVTIDLPPTVDTIDLHTGMIWIYFESETV